MARARLDDSTRIGGYAAYFEPLVPAAEFARRARRLRYEAMLTARTDGRAAEALYRQALERFVDAFLVDRAGHAWCFVEAHAIGRALAADHGCRMKVDDAGHWAAQCGVLALHSRLGLSFGGPTLGRCSLCNADDFECDHVPGRVYGGQPCRRVVHTASPHEVSLVSFPDDPRCYRVWRSVSPQEVRSARGRPLRTREVPMCTHCVDCQAVENGPTLEDVDQSRWPTPEFGTS